MKTEVLNEILTKYRENKLSHAYLIETNNLNLAINDLKDLIKNLNCPHTYNNSCTKCSLCNLINKDNLPSLKIIEPDGLYIKKSQIEALKESFKTIPVYSRYNVYIIKNADKLNSSSANSMLKFVEEPTPGILGFFLTTNKDIIIETIKSRCQIYTLNYNLDSLPNQLNIDTSTYENYQTLIKEYLELLYSSNIINHKDIILNKYPERLDITNIFKIIFQIYYDNYLMKNNLSYNEEVQNIYPLKENTLEINQKMQIIAKFLTDMSYNVSIELLLDKFVIEMRGTHGQQ